MAAEPIRMWPGDRSGSTLGPTHPERTASNVVVLFPRARDAGNRFGLRDRAELLAWAEQARAFGICRVSLEKADPPEGPEGVGDFALIYDGSSEWARWAIAPERGRYLLWSPNGGHTIGHLPSLGAALAAIHAPAS